MSAITSKRPAKEAKPAKESKKAAKPAVAAEPAKPKQFPKKAGDGNGPGVIGSIVEFLQAATAKSPLSKKELLAKLVERFPSREATALYRTINCQVPSRLRTDKELTVNKNDRGYWVE